MDYSVLVNKTNPIKDNLFFKIIKIRSLVKDKKYFLIEEKTFKAFANLKKYAKEHNYDIDIYSAYRTHEHQRKIFYDLVKEKGIDYAKKYIAKPYTSEHETGLAIDICVFRNGICNVEHSINDYEEIKWLHNNCYKFGFILRYPLGKEDITGYNYESWHIRYVGTKLATYLYQNKLSLEEYYINM